MKMPTDSGGGQSPKDRMRQMAKAQRAFLRDEVLSSQVKFEEFITRYATKAARWSPNNWCMILMQRPSLQHPITLREAEALGRKVLPGTLVASLWIPVPHKGKTEGEKSATDPAAGDAGDAPEEAVQLRPRFILKPAVVDLVTDTEGAEVALPLSPRALRREEMLALLEQVTCAPRQGAPTSSPDELRERADEAATIVVEAMFSGLPERKKTITPDSGEAHESKVDPADAQAARIAITKNLLLQAFGLPRPPLLKSEIEKGWSGPRSFMGLLRDASVALREVIGMARVETQEHPDVWSQDAAEVFVMLSDRALRAVGHADESVDISAPAEAKPAPPARRRQPQPRL